MLRKTVTSSLNKNIQGSGKKVVVRRRAVIPPAPPVSRKIFKDDVNGFSSISDICFMLYIVYIVYRWTAWAAGHRTMVSLSS
jgi:hypothetical protein